MTLLIIIYLLGYLASYILFRFLVKKFDGEDEWTIGMRTAGLVISSISVLTLIIIIALLAVSPLLDIDKPAKW